MLNPNIRVYVSKKFISLDVPARIVGFDEDSDTHIIAESRIDSSDGVIVARKYTPDEFTGDTWYTYHVDVWDAEAAIQHEQAISDELMRGEVR